MKNTLVLRAGEREIHQTGDSPEDPPTSLSCHIMVSLVDLGRKEHATLVRFRTARTAGGHANCQANWEEEKRKRKEKKKKKSKRPLRQYVLTVAPSDTGERLLPGWKVNSFGLPGKRNGGKFGARVVNATHAGIMPN